MICVNKASFDPGSDLATERISAKQRKRGDRETLKKKQKHLSFVQFNYTLWSIMSAVIH